MKDRGRFSREAELYRKPASEIEVRILRAAEEVFGQAGMQGATTAEIARHADTTERTLFKYFPTKTDLHRRLLYSIVYDVAAPIELAGVQKRIETRTLPFREWLNNLLVDRINGVQRNKNRLAILASALLHDSKFRKVFRDLWMESIYKPSVDAVRAFQERDEIRKDLDPAILTRMIASLSLSQVMLRILFPESKLPTESEVDQYCNVIMNGVHPEP